MSGNCANCDLFLILEEQRIQWYQQMSITNIELYKKISEQQDLIAILKDKLQEKRISFLAEYLTTFSDSSSGSSDDDYTENCDLLRQDFKIKLREVKAVSEAFHFEKISFQKEIEENERDHAENVSYLNGLIDYFRESLFEELVKSNKLKQYYTKKISGIATTNHHILLNTLKEETERLNNELKGRYKKTIEKCKEEIERQSQLVSKLRKHNRELYSHIHKSKKENEDKVANMEKSLQNLKITVKKLKDRNDYLHTQIKLEVEGCQNDIFDARKRIRKLINKPPS